MIDSRHRLRPERILNGRASLFSDIKGVLKSMWAFLVYVICCCYCFRKKSQERQTSIDNDEDEDGLPDDQRRPLLSSSN
jgi:hypothetical protein